MTLEKIIETLRYMARYPTVTMPRDKEALSKAADLLAEQAQAQPDDEPFAWCIESEDSADWCFARTKEGVELNAVLMDDNCIKTAPFPIYTRPQQALAQPAKAIPEGWKLVPIKPTQAMLDEMNLTGREGYDDVMGDGFSSSLYHAAIISAPAQPKAEQKREPMPTEKASEICARWTDESGNTGSFGRLQIVRDTEAAHGITQQGEQA